MLVITRKAGQGLLIGEEIRVVVLESHSDSARLGIEAPARITVLREELAEEVRQSNRQASRIDPSALEAFSQEVRQKFADSPSSGLRSTLLELRSRLASLGDQEALVGCERALDLLEDLSSED